MELEKEIQRYSKLNGYPIDVYEPVVCSCGCSELQLYSDDDEGGAIALCTECGSEIDIENSKSYMEDPVQNLCGCDNDRLKLGVGKSYYSDSREVRWVYVGCHCGKCNLVGVYVDWKET
ncbi:hypothetical protein [Marinobacter adhaerens]|uniref:hypothetical protein n=1 Tax=Marinobacter adhaerens TaxID=1033846 RepID=UPI001C59E43A|nr:hypothetical protein [Marinobacter adhaerens]MBW3228118.1 hypothetical protein [Marinobacter adhaerens]